MKSLRLAPRAQRDLDLLLFDSEARFGGLVAGRYRRLIAAAFRDLQSDPLRAGVRQRAELPDHIRLYHLRHSRRRLAAPDRIARPRHFVAFEVAPDALVILRILHDSMDLAALL
jgi:toxin ParE1/3/4